MPFSPYFWTFCTSFKLFSVEVLKELKLNINLYIIVFIKICIESIPLPSLSLLYKITFSLPCHIFINCYICIYFIDFSLVLLYDVDLFTFQIKNPRDRY